jgi:hypothetical protein
MSPSASTDGSFSFVIICVRWDGWVIWMEWDEMDKAWYDYEGIFLFFLNVFSWWKHFGASALFYLHL